MNKKISYSITGAFIIGIIIFIFFQDRLHTTEDVQEIDTIRNVNTEEAIESPNEERAFASINLETNTAKHSIDLKEIINGGPGKDGIPAIISPKFISTKEARKIEELDGLGIAVSVGETARFYPYSILVWHEIVNDQIEDTDVLVTFCPLCGTAIVLNPRVNGKTRTFGVSGLLWESNLLMYDHVNESLWSQSRGEAIVGDDLGAILDLLPSQLMTLEDFIQKYPDGSVLSRDTGYDRLYGTVPYSGYTETKQTYFPISVNDERFFPKDIMYIVPLEDHSIAFQREALVKNGSASVQINFETITATVEGSEVIVKRANGEVLPGYHEMWFSWAIHHQEDGFVWPVR